MQQIRNIHNLDNTQAEDLEPESLEQQQAHEPVPPEPESPKPHEFGRPLPGVKYRNDYTWHKRIGAGLFAFVLLGVGAGYYYAQSEGIPRWVTLKFDDNDGLPSATDIGQAAAAVQTEAVRSYDVDVSDDARQFIDDMQATALTQAAESIQDPGLLAVKAGELTRQLLIEADAPVDVAEAAAMEATDKLLREQEVKPVLRAAYLAHTHATTQGAAPSESAQRVSYIAEAVADAVAVAGGSVDDRIAAAHKAIDYEAQKYALDPVLVTQEKTRVWAIVEAKAEGLNDHEAKRQGELAIAAEAVQLPTGTPETFVAPMPVQATSPSSSQAIPGPTRSSPFINDQFGGQYAQNTQNTLASVAHGNAVAEAEQLGLRGAERADFITKRSAEIAAEGQGLSKLEVEVAGIRAAAYANSLKVGMSEINARGYADKHAVAYMDERNVPTQMQDVINSRVASAVALTTGFEAQVLARNALPVSFHADQKLEGRVNRLEQTLSSLAVQVTETNRMIIEVAQTQLNTQKENQAQFKAINGKFTGLEQSVAKMESAPTLNRFESMLAKIDGRTETLEKNYGWTSNRLCEQEAASGRYVNETTCKAIYDKVRKSVQEKAAKAPVRDVSPVANAGMAISVADSQRKKPVYPRTIARTNTHENSLIPSTASGSTVPEEYKRVLASIQKERDEKLKEEKARELAREQSISLPENPHVATQSVNTASIASATPVSAPIITARAASPCERAASTYRATMVSANRAVIENRWGASKRLVSGSYIDGLGSVKKFVVGDEQRIEFTNGVICS